MADWKTVFLGDALTFQRGFDITKDEQRDGPYPVISSSGPKTTHAEFKVRGPGVIIGRKGSLGTVFYSETDYWPHDTTLWIKNFHGNHPRFAYYFLQTMGFERLDAGASNPSLNRNHIHTIPVFWPPLPEQQRISGILSAYDELMENSQRRIRILETMARALYREWFVHFRFPGHEAVPRVASPLGPTPLGWEVKPLFELTKVNYGKNLPTKKLADNGAYPVYGAVKVIGRYTEYTRKERTIICGCRGSVGEMQITQPQCYVTNNSFTFDMAHQDNFFWIFHTLKERGLRDVVGGAAQPQITLDGISSVELLTPPLMLRTRFQQTIAPIFEQAWALDSQIQNLRQTRDLLLPRLLSGQVALNSKEL